MSDDPFGMLFSKNVGLLASMHMNMCLGVVTDNTSMAVLGKQISVDSTVRCVGQFKCLCIVFDNVTTWLFLLVGKF